MLKLLGSLFILSGGFLARWLQMSERRRRRETLSDLLSTLRRMGEEIRMTRTPLPALLERAAADCGSDTGALLLSAAKAAKEGENLCTVWQHSAKNLPLSDAEHRVVRDLGENLHGDEESICKAISLAVYELAKHASELDASRRLDDQRATALCFSASALLVILLI